MTTKTATLHTPINLAGTDNPYITDQGIYKLDPPVEYGHDWGDGAEKGTTEYVLISTSYPMGRGETFMFPATEDGEVIDFLEMVGSSSMAVPHSQVLSDAGYTLVDKSTLCTSCGQPLVDGRCTDCGAPR